LRADSSHSILRRLFAWRPGGYARASAETLVWLLLRAGLQAVNVVVLARLLGASEYGRFIAALAVVTFFVPLAGMGLGNVVLRDGAAEPARLQMLIRASLRIWLRTALTLSLIATAVVWLALPSEHAELWAVSLLGFGEVVGSSGVDLLSRYCQARQNMRGYGAIISGLMGARLLALFFFADMMRHGAQEWMGLYGSVSLGYLALVAILQWRGWRGNTRPQPGWWREGTPFAVVAVSFRLQSEFNKPVLARLSYADAGAFNIVQRAIDVASLPLAAMQEALWPRVFADANAHRRLRSALFVMLALATGLGCVLTAAAPALPWLLGSGFDAVAPALRWLAWLPTLQVLRNIGNARLIVSGQSYRLTRVYAAGAAVGPVLSVLLIPRWGLSGAVAAAYGTETILIGLQWYFFRGNFTAHNSKK
jgi:O-antigen/teichoic acid export membrane protein